MNNQCCCHDGTTMPESCGCCEGTERLTPLQTANRPGLNALVYRVGTHATFLETMKARLSNLYLEIERSKPDPHGHLLTDKIYPLRSLTTRAADDPAIALLDAWATVGDVLTFYQERVANEGYLRAAIERRSVLELARLIGYVLRLGVAASVYLAFTLEKDSEVVIPAGTRAQSVPGPGELPQSFETAEPLLARGAWNFLQPRLIQPQTEKIIRDKRRVYLKGTSTNLKPNDPLLIEFSATSRELFRVVEVKPDAAADRTVVLLREWTERIQPPPSADTVREIIRRFSQVEQFGVSRTTATCQGVLELLGTLNNTIVKATKPEEWIGFLRDQTLPSLRARLERLPPQAAKLRPWLQAVVVELEAAVPPKPADSTPPSITSRDQLVSGGLLLRRPSLQPANASRLPRTVAAITPISDAAIQLLTAFEPKLGTSLPVALGNARVTEDSPIRVYAFRVKAAPFGHNAPLKPILDNQGRTIDHEEWPIDGTVTIGITLSNRAQQATISIKRDSSVQSTTVQFNAQQPQDQEVLVGQDRVRITTTFSDGESPTLASYRFEFVTLERRTVEIRTLAADGSQTVSIDQDGPQKVVAGQTLQYVARWHKVAIALDANRAVLTVSDSWPLPPSPLNVVNLDAPYDQIVPKSFAAIIRSDRTDCFVAAVTQAQTLSRAEYGITGKSTQLTLDQNWLTNDDRSLALLRGTTVYAQSEELPLTEEKNESDICGADQEIELDGLYTGLQPGRWLIVSGERTDIPGTTGVNASELVMLAEVRHDVKKVEGDDKKPVDLRGDKIHTFIRLAGDLAYCYKRDTVKIYGNVVKATHGETRQEVLGSGDGSKALPQFTLKQSPLTYVSASNPSGVESTLEVRVNGVRWHETDSLAGLGPTDRYFITRTDDEDKTTIVFGNGQRGARVPTGMENVKAVYRIGIGKPGNVRAEQISLLVTRPLGVKEIINPLPASGGADRESRDQARRNAPLAVMSLDRLVSTQDYADFARTFAGIGKASAVRLSDGRRQLVHLTIAGADDIPIEEHSDLDRNLREALHQFGDPYQPFQIAVRELMLLVISAQVRLLPDYLWESVEPKIRAALLDAFSFERRELGQDALLSEVISVIQPVEGVAYVDVDLFGSVPEKVTEANGKRRLLTPGEIGDQIRALIQASVTSGPEHRVGVNLAEVEPGGIRPAQLAYLTPVAPATLILTEITQ